MDLGSIKIKRFADGEIYVQVQVRELHKNLLAEHRPVKSPTQPRSFHTCSGLNRDASTWSRPVACNSYCSVLSCVQESIRGCDVFLVQPSCPPVNDHLMELLVMIDACKRASARSITAVIPYYGYARADRKTQGRESIAAKLTANLITEAGMAAFLHTTRGALLGACKLCAVCGSLWTGVHRL